MDIRLRIDGDLAARPYGAIAAGTPGHGSAVIAGGKVTYTPASGYVGADSSSYTVSDGKGGTASANVSLTVEAPPANQWVSLTPGATSSWYDGGTGLPYSVSLRSNYLGQGYDALLAQKIPTGTADHNGQMTNLGQFTINGAAGPSTWSVAAGQRLGFAFDARALGVATQVRLYLHYPGGG